MNYAQTAQTLASKGRYGDTTLVHMTPQEVGGLQALARSRGTTLTINPTTGLPEAFNLRSLLPTLLGAGLAVATGGTSLAMSPLQIGMLTGGLGTLATGDIKKGLMMGLGAAGGAGLAGSAGLTGASAASAAPAGGAVGGTGITAATPPALPPASSVGGVAPPMDTSTFSGINPAVSYNPATMSYGSSALPQPDLVSSGAKFTAGPGTGGAGFSATKGLATSGYGADPYSLGSKFGTPIGETYGSSAGITPSETSTALTPKPAFSTADFLSANKSNLSMAAAPVLAYGFEPPKGPEPSKAMIRPYDLSVTNLSGQDPYAPGSTQEREQVRYAFTPREPYYAADGGLMEIGDDKEPVEMMGGGLAAFKQGTYLQGSGDGMSDSIPAVIGSRQPARLADGEFVVPADVVSGLGNGSSNAGAKQLHAMMDRVREGRTGKKKQAPEIKPKKYMPA